MAVPLPRQALRSTLDRAVRDARDPGVEADERWTARIDWLSFQVAGGDAKGKTYVAAVGGALLAKATDARVDTMTQSSRAGARGYSLRAVTELLQGEVRGRVHLGTLSRNPVNNSPFLRGPARVDRFVVAGYVTHIYDEYVDWMRELDGYSVPRAHDALVAFLRVRMAVQQREDANAAAGTHMTVARSLGGLVETVDLWVREDPEDGARAQATVAAALGLAWDDVVVVPKHHPAPFDIRRAGLPPPLTCECKQQLVSESDVLDLAMRTAEHGGTACLYAAMGAGQAPLPTDRIRRDALTRYGVMLWVAHDVLELVAGLAVHSEVTAAMWTDWLPRDLAARCPEADVSAAGLRRLSDLLAGV